MKKYVSGFLFFFSLTVITLVGLFYVTIGLEQEQVKQVQAIDTLEYPAFAETENTRIDQEEFTDDAETVVHLVLNQEQVEKLYDLRRKMGLSGKHPADLCAKLNGPCNGCHAHGGSCSCGSNDAPASDELVAEVTKRILAELKNR